MSKLNEQMVHIATEIVVILGLTFYFNQKTKKLMGCIDELNKKVQEQEELLKKHEQIIKQMIEFINKLEIPKEQPKEKNGKKTKIPKSPVVTKKDVLKIPLKVSEKTNNIKIEPKPKVKLTKIQELESEEESDLDAELEEELKELIESDKDEDEDEDEDEDQDEDEDIQVLDLKKNTH